MKVLRRARVRGTGGLNVLAYRVCMVEGGFIGNRRIGMATREWWILYIIITLAFALRSCKDSRYAGIALPVTTHKTRRLILDGLNLFNLRVVGVVRVPYRRPILHDGSDKGRACLGFGILVTSP